MYDISAIQRLTPEQQKAVLTEVRKSLAGEYGVYGHDNVLRKDATNNVGVTTGLGTLPIPLEAPAKLLYPILTPLRNMMPREVKGGNSVTFRQITGINTQKRWASVPEASTAVTGRNNPIAFNEKNVTYNFKTLEEENLLTPEAEFGGQFPGQDFGNREFATLAVLESMMRMEELAILGGNASALGNVSGIAKHATQLAEGTGSLTANTAYYVTVAPVTLQGYFSGAQGQVATVDAPGEGAGVEATLTTAASGAGDKSLAVKWDALPKAVAYNVFVSASTGAANSKYHSTVTTPYVEIRAVPSSGNRTNAADQTANANDFDGLYSLINAAAGATVVNYENEPFTSDGRGGVEQVSSVLRTLWLASKVSPDYILCHATDRDNMAKIIASASNPIVRLQAQFGDGKISGGLAFGSLLNPYFGDRQVPLIVHPDATQGTLLGVCQNLGENFPNARIASNFVMRLCWDYRREEFARAKRAEEFGISMRGALVNYAPFASFKITGIKSTTT